MNKLLFVSALMCLLSACASGGNGSSNTEMYGEIIGGVETVHTSTRH